MIALATLPQKWEMLISIITGDIKLNDLNLADMCNAVVTQYQSETIHNGPGKQNANKISVVKHKHGDPSWKQQQGNQQQCQN
jgi:hypothetical protein